MKKRLFLVFALALIVCTLFALSTSAKTLTKLDGETVEVTIIPNAPAKATFANSTDDYVIFDTGFACPSTYIFKDQATVSKGSYGNAGLKNALDFSFLTENGYYKDAENKVSYTIDNIVELDIPEGITTLGDQFAHSLSSVKKITFPHTVTSIGSTGFQNSAVLEEVVFEHTEADTEFTTLSGWMFAGCSKLKALSIPDCITTITGEGNFFNGCSSLGPVYLSKNIQILEKTGSNRYAVFQNLSKVYFVSEPFTTSDTAPAKPDIYYFPESLHTIHTNTFEGATSINSVLVFGTQITSASGSYLFKNVTSTVVFLGDMTEINTTNWKTSKIIFANANDKSSSDFASYTNSRTTVFCASETDTSKHLASPKHSTIEPATCYSNEKGVTRCFCTKVLSEGETPNTMLTTHNYINDFDCTTPNLCENFGEGKCDKFLDAEALEHIEKHAVAYAEGFAKSGLHTVWCDNEGCKALDNEITLGAMISTSGGYSTNANGGLAGGWTVNTDLVTLFNDYNEKDVQFGIFMVNPSHLTSNSFMVNYAPNLAEGKSGALVVEMTGTEYANFAFQISGFNSEELKKLELVIAAYAYVEGEDVEYIQDADTVCKVTTLDYADGSLYTVTYEKASSELSPVSVEAVIPTIKKDNF
ncbi:MAG: leucine-rich repeat protein [Clostridia bacterium]|nr:leucine-rich repeat protein [Clostridia bacterium]